MRIPLDLIAAILCVEGIERYLRQSASGNFLPHVSLGLVLAAWGGFFLCTWLLNELLTRRLEGYIHFGLRPGGRPGGPHPQVLHSWGTRVVQAVTVVLFCGLLFLLRWPLRMEFWPQWFGWPADMSAGQLRLAKSATAGVLLNVIPFVFAMVLGWLPRRRLISGLRRRPVPLRGFLANEAGLTLLPLVLLLILSLCGDLFLLLPRGVIEYFSAPGVDLLSMLLLLGLCAFVILPKLIIWLWRCAPLPDGELRDRLMRLLAVSRVKARDILSWGPRNSNLLNACVLGPWSRFRYVLISPQLVEELGLTEAEAVLAHELGHARYGHLTLLFVLLLFMSALWMWMAQALVLAAPASPLVETGVSMLFVILYIWRFLGSVLRQCEREADLASAETMGTPAPLVAALERLAALSGNSRSVYSWHHGSIAQRVAVVERLAADPRAAAALHRRLRWMRWLLSLATVLALAGQVFW